jgi:hypothetical protein
MHWGHPPAAVWSYTPKQAFAWMTLGAARAKRERAMAIGDNALAAHGEGKHIKRAIEDLSGA